jgi:hypothetical protein
VPEHNSQPSAKQHEGNGMIHFHPEDNDVYHVKIADATVTADGKCEFRTDLDQERFRVEVFSGTVDVATSTLSTKVGEGKILEHNSSGTELAFNTQKGIVKDAWDQWTEARDKQVQLTQKDEAIHPNGPRYGWSDLDTYGEWVTLPGGRFGWSPYAMAGWSPYTNGMWDWYPGFGWTWISGEPWGWLPYHCGLWDFDTGFGWYWMEPMFGCGAWGASLVDWYAGPGWIGWRPKGPVHPMPHPPGHPRPGHPSREIATVPTNVLQNRQMITPQSVRPVLATAGTPIEHPPFEPVPRPSMAATSLAPSPGTKFNGAASPASALPVPALTARGGTGFATRRASAPSSVLMGGDPAKERSLLVGHRFHSSSAPLRAAEGTTLGGRYAVHGSPGEFRGNAFSGGGRTSGAGGGSGRSGASVMSHSSGGSGAVIASHGSSGGGSGGSGSSGFSGGGGGHAGGGGGGGVTSGGGGSSSVSGASAGGGGHH